MSIDSQPNRRDRVHRNTDAATYSNPPEDGPVMQILGTVVITVGAITASIALISVAIITHNMWNYPVRPSYSPSNEASATDQRTNRPATILNRLLPSSQPK